MAPVDDPRLVQPRAQPHGQPLADPAGRRRPPAPATHADHADPTRPDPPARAQRPAAHLCQHRDALVGRLPDLRHDAGAAAVRAQRRARQAADRPRWAGAAADRPGAQPGHGPGLLAWADHAPDAVHPGAQRDLRPAAGRVSVMVRRPPVREGPAGQRGSHRQDPHDRVDTGRDQPPDDPDRAAGELVGLAGERLHRLFGRLSDSEILSGSPAPRRSRSTTGCRTRSPRSSWPSTGCTR